MRKALLVTVALAACSTTTTIHSTPSGAKVYLDGAYRGETPLTLELPDGSNNGYKHVRLEKEGYASTETAIGRRQDPVRLVCGYFCLFPLLWVYKWDEAYTLPMRLEGEAAGTPTPPPATGTGTQL
ncbi:MAG: PEGA domain-containing protein [Myxococcota bacterium]